MRFIIIVVLFALATLQAMAQDKELENKDFFGETKWEPTLSDAYKISDSPKPDTSLAPAPDLKYNITPQKFYTTFEPAPIKPVKVKDETISKLYKNYVKLGFGNYTTPYAELFVNNLRSKDYSMGAHLKHQSSSGQLNDYGPSGFSDNSVHLFGDRYFTNYTVGASLLYNRNVVHFYGFDPDKYSYSEKDIRQRFNYVKASVELASRYMDKFKVHHMAKINYYNSSDLFNSKENELFIEANADKALNQFTIGLAAEESFINYSNDPATVNRNIFSISPSIGLKENEWALTGGFKVAVESDTNTSKSHLYPEVRLRYSIIENILTFNGLLTGGIQKNNFRIFSSENPFIEAITNFRNTNNKVDFSASLKTSLSQNSTFTAGMNYKDMSNIALFVNNGIRQIKFDVIYDNAQMLNLHAAFSHQRSERLRILLKGDYFKYSTENELKAWNKPTFQLSLSGHYNLQNKISIKADLFAIGERFAKGLDVSNKAYAITLHGVIDANLGLEYRFTKLLSFYLSLNNLGGVRYYQWNNYPAQRINMMAGITYSF